ncbi:MULTISPECIES: MurR/RpiR family transcriptional regulator [Clostridium]|uniref:RpiR family glv operon transcriptional regulator n=1 Tax=Clostridium beijerinckii TaxID=1520 RepID=A0A1B9BI22_CLOBE|nr:MULTISPECIES: MurR/RpiR family transcriptional regulator [Clostridium]AQS07563.1 HTH-type transcriptional regulator GlvR [Clostridium beijerinckii]MBA2884189.1 RpiR family glv operon transcriptional regulator [Clostridium beijerinckii]MBA2898258.1 RpiR family glv operon transcriptional regulator [Clostridium beijerinckii]MBA2908957.1 RpiR family glv operon transcriptional regulator [Clostridium beijerinckii]MBA9012800.1 RpiR family glv operon transcriptional regulator [Clostridium beijerinc
MKLDELINKYHKHLNENDLYIWNYISKHRKECETLTIDQLAHKCNVSRTTILRFSQKLSLKGYGELKVYLKLDNEKSKENVNNVEAVCDAYNEVIKNIKEKDCTDIFELIDKSRTLYVYGIGMVQSSIKKEFKRTFLTAGKIFYDLSGYTEANAIVDLATDEDVFVIISVSGENQFIMDFAKNLKIKNIPIISITKLKDNSLAKLSDYNLYTSTALIPSIYNDIDFESLTSYFILIEILFLKYMEYKTQKNKKEEKHEIGNVD